MESRSAQPNPKSDPPKKELMNILSIRIRAFFAPIRETSSVVWAGVKASMMAVRVEERGGSLNREKIERNLNSVDSKRRVGRFHISLDIYQPNRGTSRSKRASKRTAADVIPYHKRLLPRDRREGKGRSGSTRA